MSLRASDFAWLQWMVKVGVAFGLALVFGAGLPILLIQLAPHETSSALRMSGDLTVLIVLLTASSIYISSLSGSGVRAMVLSLPAGIGVAFFIRVVTGALGWVMSTLAGPWMGRIVTGAVAPASVDPTDVFMAAARMWSLALVPLLVWFAFANHRSSERTVRRAVGQIATIAAVITIGTVVVGGVLAFYELS
jgi:hypothetical protein